MAIGKELLLGLCLALESTATDIERVRAILRDPRRDATMDARADLMLAKAWLRIENARRALDASGGRPQ